jgi:hypothetical protein
LFVAISSGAGYAYSAWSPQFGARLRLTHTQLNIITLSSSIGFYTTVPIWGRLVDSRGPQIPLAAASLFLLSGYSGIKYFFDLGLPTTSISANVTFFLIILCGYMNGAASAAGMISAVNTTAKSFPDTAVSIAI